MIRSFFNDSEIATVGNRLADFLDGRSSMVDSDLPEVEDGAGDWLAIFIVGHWELKGLVSTETIFQDSGDGTTYAFRIDKLTDAAELRSNLPKGPLTPLGQCCCPKGFRYMENAA